MPSIPLEQALNMAMQRQQAGQLGEAERLYRQIVVQQPDCADALHLLGIACGKGGGTRRAWN